MELLYVELFAKIEHLSSKVEKLSTIDSIEASGAISSVRVVEFGLMVEKFIEYDLDFRCSISLFKVK